MSLAEILNAIREDAARKIPPDTLAEMHRATREVAESGIMDGVAQVGSRLPDFALTNQHGETVRSAELLGTGPLVLNMFRGSW